MPSLGSRCADQTATSAKPHLYSSDSAPADVGGIGRPHGDDAADCRTSVERRCGTVQHLDALDQTRVDEIARRIGETANVELVRERHAVDQYRDAIAADPSDADAFGSEAGTRGLCIDAGHVTEHVRDRSCKLCIQVVAIDNGNVGGDLSDRARVFVGDDNDLIDDVVVIDTRSFGSCDANKCEHKKARRV